MSAEATGDPFAAVTKLPATSLLRDKGGNDIPVAEADNLARRIARWGFQQGDQAVAASAAGGLPAGLQPGGEAAQSLGGGYSRLVPQVLPGG